MTDDLVVTLKALSKDPSRAIDLYGQLYSASFFAIVKSGSEHSLSSSLFLTYPSVDEIRELPVFTLQEYVLADIPQETTRIHVDGPHLWGRMLDIVETGKCEVAVDPGQVHGIRLNREMILGMVSKYGAQA